MSFYWEQKCEPLTGVWFLSGWAYIDMEASIQFSNISEVNFGYSSALQNKNNTTNQQ